MPAQREKDERQCLNIKMKTKGKIIHKTIFKKKLNPIVYIFYFLVLREIILPVVDLILFRRRFAWSIMEDRVNVILLARSTKYEWKVKHYFCTFIFNC